MFLFRHTLASPHDGVKKMMQQSLLSDSNKSLAQFIEFCKDTSLWQELQYKDAVRQLALLSYRTAKKTGVTEIVLMAKAWELSFWQLFGPFLTFQQMLDIAKRFLAERKPYENKAMAETVYSLFLTNAQSQL